MNKFEVRNNMESEVWDAITNRPHLIDDAPEVLGLQVLSPKENDAEFWLNTHWELEKQFYEWHHNHDDISGSGMGYV